MKSLDKFSFTLLETIIVLVVMGFIYTLSVTSFSKQTIENNDIYFDMKAILHEKLKTEKKSIEFILLNDDSYTILIDNLEIKGMDLKLPKEIEFFTYNQNGNLKDKFKPLYKNKYYNDVKFRFKIYKNNSSTKAIIKVYDKYFIQNSYFNNKKIFYNIYDAKKYLLQENLRQEMVEINE